MKEYALGERVIGGMANGNVQRAGVVRAVLNENHNPCVWGGEVRYLIDFDHGHGLDGPCVVFRADGEREDTPPTIGTAA